MENYTRKQLRERWEKAKENMSDPETVEAMAVHIVPGIWDVRIFPRWLFKKFMDRKIIEARDSSTMSRNVAYDPDSDHTQEWGWFHWSYYFDSEEHCYVLELNYNVRQSQEPGDTKPLPLVSGILDLALVESLTSIIGKFKWRSPLLQKIPLIRRIPFIKAHRLLFYFEMKIEDQDEESALFAYGRETGREIDEAGTITFPKGSKSWGKVLFVLIGDPTGEGKCIARFHTTDGETFTGEDDICFQ